MSDRRRGRALMWTADRKTVAMDRICDRISGGETLRDICVDPWMPSRGTVLEWIRTDGAIAGQYSRALQARADTRSDRIDGYMRDLLAGKISPAAASVLIETEKWQMSKEAPRRYGRHAVQEPARYESLSDAQLETQIAALMARLSPDAPFGRPVRTGAHARVMGYYNG